MSSQPATEVSSPVHLGQPALDFTNTDSCHFLKSPGEEINEAHTGRLMPSTPPCNGGLLGFDNDSVTGPPLGSPCLASEGFIWALPLSC